MQDANGNQLAVRLKGRAGDDSFDWTFRNQETLMQFLLGSGAGSLEFEVIRFGDVENPRPVRPGKVWAVIRDGEEDGVFYMDGDSLPDMSDGFKLHRLHDGTAGAAGFHEAESILTEEF